MTVRYLDARQVRRALPWKALVDALRQGFRTDYTVPVRHHHTLPQPLAGDATLLLMPAWQSGRYLGVKIATIFPGNSHYGLPAVYGIYELCNGATGEPLALFEGGELTARRTAAASALASSYLSRRDAARLVMVGTGRLSLNLIAAHRAVRPIEQVTVWGRSSDKAMDVARQAAALGVTATATDNLAAACREADIICAATLATDPLIRGEWLQPGTHLDLVGGFRPDMREADDECVRRAQLFVDTFDGALSEAGDLLQPLESGVIGRDSVRGDLFELCRGNHPGREDDEAVTLFKSVGTALEDLAAAILAYEHLSRA